MRTGKKWGMLAAGIAAGAVNGLFGAGGGMILVPLLMALTELSDEEIFPASICVILSVCLVSLSVTAARNGIDWSCALPWLPGSALGGLAAGLWGRKIPVRWLHFALGLLILWGGVRYLC